MVSEWLALNIHKVGKLDNNNFNHLYVKLAEGPGVACGKKNVGKKMLKIKFQTNRSSRLAGYREHIYECLVLLYRYTTDKKQGFFLLNIM